jgi:hypothetical protein
VLQYRVDHLDVAVQRGLNQERLVREMATELTEWLGNRNGEFVQSELSVSAAGLGLRLEGNWGPDQSKLPAVLPAVPQSRFFRPLLFVDGISGQSQWEWDWSPSLLPHNRPMIAD